MDSHYFKLIKDEKLLGKLFEQAFVEIERDIHDEKDIVAYVQELMNKPPIPFEDLQFRVYLIKNYT